MSATGVKVNVALATFELAPTVVVREPAGMELLIDPVTVLVTTVVTVQEEFGGMTEPLAIVSVPRFALTDTIKLEAQLVAAVEPKLTKPTG